MFQDARLWLGVCTRGRWAKAQPLHNMVRVLSGSVKLYFAGERARQLAFAVLHNILGFWAI